VALPSAEPRARDWSLTPGGNARHRRDLSNLLASGVKLPWLVRWVTDQVATRRGVILKGVVTESVGVTQHGDHDYDIGADESPRSEGTWFLGTSDPDACTARAASSRVILLVPFCCDVVPPAEVH
jgi:hypothetical protein